MDPRSQDLFNDWGVLGRRSNQYVDNGPLFGWLYVDDIPLCIPGTTAARVISVACWRVWVWHSTARKLRLLVILLTYMFCARAQGPCCHHAIGRRKELAFAKTNGCPWPPTTPMINFTIGLPTRSPLPDYLRWDGRFAECSENGLGFADF